MDQAAEQMKQLVDAQKVQIKTGALSIAALVYHGSSAKAEEVIEFTESIYKWLNE